MYEYIAQQIREHNPSIDLRSFDIVLATGRDESTADWNGRMIYGAVRDEYTDTFAAEKCTVELDVAENGDVYFSKLNLNYIDGYDMDAFYAERDRALAVIEPEMTDEQKAIAIHDYLISHCVYNFEAYSNLEYVRDNFTAYGALVDHKAVCEGYSLAYKYLLNAAGVECYQVESSSMQHVWNMVVLDGEPYHVELVADDPSWDMLGQVRHDCLFITDDEILNDCGYPHDWQIESFDIYLDLKATSTKYDNAFWKKKIVSPLAYHDGMYYFSVYYNGAQASDDIGCISADTPTGNIQYLVKNASKPVAGVDMVWEPSHFVAVINDRIVYNTPIGFNSCRFDGSDVRTDVTVDTTNGFVYGAAIYDGKLYYALEKTWVATGPEEYILLTDNLDDYWPPEINSIELPVVSDSSAAASDTDTEDDAEPAKFGVSPLVIAGAAAALIAVVVIIALAVRGKAKKK